MSPICRTVLIRAQKVPGFLAVVLPCLFYDTCIQSWLYLHFYLGCGGGKCLGSLWRGLAVSSLPAIGCRAGLRGTEQKTSLKSLA